jgi:hypothetical protein
MRQVVILDCPKRGGKQLITGVMWFSIPTVAAQVPIPGFSSALASFVGAKALTAQEQADLASGAVREEHFAVEFADTTTGTQMQDELQRQWTARNAAIAAEPAVRRFYARTWDGVSWVA